MYSRKSRNFAKKLLFALPLLLVLPAILVFDSLVYLIARPSCLNCSNLIEFLKNGSLTVFLVTNAGYQLGRKT